MTTVTNAVDDRLRRIANRAATLNERIAIPGSAGPPAEVAREASAVVRAWRSALGSPADEAFARRLGWDGLSPETIDAAAARGLAPDAPLPPWTGWLRAAIDEAAGVARDLERGTLPDLPVFPPDHEPPFVELAMPWLRAARHGLDRLLPAEVPRPPLERLYAQLLREWGIYAGAAVFEWFAAARHARPDDPLVYDTFVRRLLADDLWSFFEAHPVLGRHLAIVADTWTRSTAELCTRLAEDRSELERVFGADGPLGAVTGIEPALSDPHDGRRRVAAVQFASGVRVVYKPRDLAVDRAFFEVLAWAASRGLSPVPSALAVVVRPTHGWVAFAEPAAAFTTEQARRYFDRAGRLLAWAHILRGRDLHLENVVATADGPVLVDLEVLVQPLRWDTPEGAQREGPLSPGTPSCLETGFVGMLDTDGTDGVVDVGGLQGGLGWAGPRIERAWRHRRTAALSLVETAGPAGPRANAVSADGRPVGPRDFREAFVAGFETTYRFVLAHRAELLHEEGPLRAFAGAPVRVLARPTRQYGQLVQALNAPRFQVDGAERSAWLDILKRPYAARPTRPPAWAVLTAEHERLESLDIPRFWVRADSCQLHEGTRPVAGEYLVMGGLDAVRRQVEHLSLEDLAAQTAQLRDALGHSVADRFATAFVSPPADPGADQRDVFLSAARTLADELLARVPIDGARGPDAAAVQHWSLYRGAIGWPVFLGALAAATGEARWHEAAAAYVEPVVRFVERARPVPGDAAVGATTGWGSITYGLGLLGRLVDTPTYLDAARIAASHIRPADEAVHAAADVTDGWAGAILALVSLARLTGDPCWLTVADGCAARLEAAAQQTPAGPAWTTAGDRVYLGFAHGGAGIGTALLALGHAGGSPRWLALGRQAWDTVNAGFLPERANWPVSSSGDADRPMTAWCHGAAGILIGLGRALDFGGERAILTHAFSALAKLQQVPDHLEEHLCCGNLGRADALLTFGILSGVDAAVAAARAVGWRVLERAARRQHVRLCSSGFVYRVFDPGFFRGLAGVGYELVRLATPATVPSVMGFE